MPKKGRKKLRIDESDSDTEVFEVPLAVKTEVVYDDTKVITGVDSKLKWGHIYPMLVERKVPEAGLGDLSLYENILSSRLTKIGTRPELFPYVEVICWLLPKIETVGMIINYEEGNPIASFAPTFISKSYSLVEA